MHNNGGYILIEQLLVLFGLCLFLPILASCYKIITNFDFRTDYQFYNQTYQLRHDVFSKDILSMSSSQIEYEDCALVINNDKIYMTPGTFIYYADFDYAEFNKIDRGIYLTMIKNNRRVDLFIDYE